MLMKVFPSTISGSVKGPSSKSCTQRALAAALIKTGTSVIRNAGFSNDEKAARSIIKSLGATIDETDGEMRVEADVNIFNAARDAQAKTINCGESGLSMRMFAPIAALFHHPVIMQGEGSILTRPMDFIDQYLPELGVSVKTNEGRVPIAITGPLKPHEISVDGSFSSQFLTGMLFAFCKAATEPVTIHAKNLTSRPYIDLTMEVLASFGFHIENENYEAFHIQPGNRFAEREVVYEVEGDWSNAAFLLVAGAIGGEVTVSGMDMNSRQGDKRILEALLETGAAFRIKETGLHIQKPEVLKAFTFDATHCPDLFPPLTALAAHCPGTSVITGVGRLIHKESNRAVALEEEFRKMNVAISIDGDDMLITGTQDISGATVSSHNDHRIAMAAALAALNATDAVIIEGAEAVDKSYPGFYEDLKRLGVAVS